MNILHEHAQTIIDDTLKQVQPHAAVQRALEGRTFPGKCIAIAIGKAAWTMAKAASDLLGNTIDHGVVLTKYDHSQGEIPGFIIAEGGHPLEEQKKSLPQWKTSQKKILSFFSFPVAVPHCSKNPLVL